MNVDLMNKLDEWKSAAASGHGSSNTHSTSLRSGQHLSVGCGGRVVLSSAPILPDRKTYLAFHYVTLSETIW